MDDLVKRLREYGGNRLWPHGPACDCTQAAARIEALERQVKAADALAELLNLPDQSDGLSGRYHYDWHKVDTALAAYRATKEGGAP